MNNTKHLLRGNVLQPSAPGLPDGLVVCFCGLKGTPCPKSAAVWAWAAGMSLNGSHSIKPIRSRGFMISLDREDARFFPPEVALHLVKMACELPDKRGVSLSQWDCRERATQLVAEHLVDSISSQTVQRILANHKLKPWRQHMWIGTKHPRDETFYRRVTTIIDLYTRAVADDEIILSYDEKTSLQPRPRIHPTKAALPGSVPVRVEHEYRRCGAVHLFAAFDTRSGKVYGQCHDRKRQQEFIAFLEHLDRQISPAIKTIHMIGDNLRVHTSQKVRQWLLAHPRFQFHFTPVHCSWMNQIEQWFSIVQRKRLRIADFASTDDLRDKIMQFIDQWNERAHPFHWTSKSVAKIMANAPSALAA